MNPMQLLQMMQGNPQMIMQQFGGNPLFQRAMQMGQGKNEDELKTIIRNIADQRGISVDQLNMFLTPLGLKL